MNRRQALSLAAAMGVAAVARPPLAVAQQALTPLTIGALRSLDMVNLYYGFQQNAFQKAGLDLTIQTMSSGAAAVAAVAGGSINIAVTNVLSLAQAALHGIPLRVLAASSTYSPEEANGNELLVGPYSNIRTASDLEGKTIAVTSIHDLMTLAISSWIDGKGADHTKVSYIEMPPGAMFAALQADHVSAMMIYDPFLSAAKAQGARVLAEPLQGIAPRYTITAWFAIEPWVSQNRDVALRFASVLNGQAPYLNAHYDEIVPVIASFTKLPEDTLRRMTPPVFLPLKTAPLQPVLDLAAKYKEIDDHIDARRLILPGAV